jgi:RIO-like serine/threonine protein kinase
VYERTKEQIIGFVCEEVKGRFAGPEDFEECRTAVEELHEVGVVHGDLNKYNIIIGIDGVRFIDLEKAVVDIDISRDEFSRLQVEELNGLENTLNDKEGWGKPWKG